MFKIESYITPIILNHVDKYVKDFRPKDSSVSLWEGEVIFQNLFLKCDVLEDELNLPFEFLSGHIHELTLHVPWTKITSEPIVATINTIEFVIKLKRPNKPTNKPSPKKEKHQSQDEVSGQGFIPGLATKILQNIVVNCHNIILKWVEDDIVVSLNVQHLSYGSANSSWDQDYVDVNPMKVVLRKLVKCTDLTICLDKRNSEGQIDVCQEPILYRCSLEIRLLRIYNALKASEASTMHIAILTKLMEINLSTIQIPMFMKLMKIIENWQEEMATESSVSLDSESVESLATEEASGEAQSYFQWVWDMMPTFSEESEEEVEELLETERGHVIKCGFYIETARLNIKQSEFIVDTILGTSKKIKYDNIFRLTLWGIFFETLASKKLNWSSFSGGASKIDLEVLDSFADTVKEENTILSTATTPSNNYFSGSLFDDSITRHEDQFLILNIDSYRMFVRDNFLTERCPGIVLSSCSYKEEKVQDEGFISRKHEIANEQAPENSELRILVQNPVFKINTPLYKVIDLIQKQLANIKPGISTVPSDKKLHPPLQDDFDSLMINVPLKITSFNIQDLQLEVSGKTFSNRQMKELHTKNQVIPRFILKIDSIDGNMNTPFDVKKLVHTTCQLPEKPEKLLKSCYDNVEVFFSNVQIFIAKKWDSVRLINIPDVQVFFRKLLLPDLWTDTNIEIQDLRLEMRIVQIQCTLPQYLTLMRMVSTLKSFNSEGLLQLIKSSASTDMFKDKFEMFEILLENNTASWKASKNLMYGSFSIENLEARLSQKSFEKKINIFKCKRGSLPSWLKITASLPTDFEDSGRFIQTSLSMGSYVLELNENIIKFLDYLEKFKEVSIKEPSPDTSDIQLSTNLSSRPTLTRRTSRKSITSDRGSRKISHPEETIHFSSDKDDRVEIEVEYKKSDIENQSIRSTATAKSNFWNVLKKIGVQVNISSGDVLLVSKDIHGKEGYSTIVLPEISLRSSNNDKDSTFPWTTTIKDFALLCRNQPILRPLQTTITIALSHKTELYTQKKYDNFETIDEDDSSRRGSKESKRTKDKRRPLSDEATGGDVTESESVAPLAKRKVQLERDVVTVNLHMDTSPIQTTLGVQYIPLMTRDLGTFSAIVAAMKTPIDDCSLVEDKPVENTNIKEFLEYETNSESSKNLERVECVKPPIDYIFSLLLQWTITKFTLEIEKNMNDSNQNKKMILEIEDIITTFDKRTDYYKFTNKIGIFQVKFFKKDLQGEYFHDESLSIKMRTDLAQLPFLNLIITNVALKNYFEKIGAKKNCADGERFLSEIVLNMRALEVIVDLGMLKQFVPTITKPQPEQNQVVCRTPITAKDLPMVYFDCKGLAIYLPDHNLRTPWCSALLIKISNIKIASNPENPLQRSPVRSDLYNKAAQMGMLYTPGSAIEDRQYEVHFKDISAMTCNWSHVMSHFKDHADTHNTNPAFEWNNQGKKAPIELRNIFSGFNFLITYAPCIDYQGVLVCGETLELNCANDFLSEMTVDQVFLMYMLYNNYVEVMGQLYNYVEPQPITKFLRKNLGKNLSNDSLKPKVFEGPKMLNSDSGIFSTVEKPIKAPETKMIPSTLTFVSGIFFIRLFTCRRVPISKDSNTIQEIIEPLLALRIHQPSLILSKTFYEEVFQISIFNFGVYVGNQDSEDIRLSITDPTIDPNSTNKFPQALLETRKGTLGHSGIPAPVFTYKKHLSRNKKIDLSLLIQKPLYITISKKIVEDLLHVTFVILKPFIQNSTPSNPITEIPITRGSKIQLIKANLLNADSVNLKMSSISFKLVNKSVYNILLVATDLNANCKFIDQQDKFVTKTSIGAFHIRSGGKMVLHPVNMKSNIELIQEPWQVMPMCISNVKFNVFQIDLDVENINQLMSVLQDLKVQQQNLNQLLESFDEIQNQSRRTIYHENFEDLKRISTPSLNRQNKTPEIRKNVKGSIEFYQDDLRAGAFQFIEMTTDKFLPLPYQIQIIKKHFGILCWRYPQPRSIDRIILFPIPIATNMDIKCRMEYFSESHQSFLHFCDFNLSETQTKEPVIPEDSVTANIWRVVILQPMVAVNKDIFDGNDEDDIVDGLLTYKIESFASESDNLIDKEDYSKDLIFDPKILVGCMRIDTRFNTQMIPTIQFLISCNRFEVNLQNYFYADTIPPPLLKKYHLCPNSTTTETFVTLILSNAHIFWSSKTQKDYSIHSNMIFSVKCLDNAFLSVLNFIEDMAVESYVSVKSDCTTDVNLIASKMSINVGPSIIQSLMASINHWQSELKHIFSEGNEETPNRKYMLTKITIINRTNEVISFGQSGTQENIPLQPQEFIGYSFLSDYYSQKLTFFLTEHNRTYESKPVPINFNGKHLEDSPIKNSPTTASHSNNSSLTEHLEYVKIGSNFLIVKFRKLSSTQILVFLKGQIEIVSMVSDLFRMQLKVTDSVTNNSEITSEFRTNSMQKLTILESVNNDTNISLRFKFDESKSKSWTGDIPLRSNKSLPWFVKVPMDSDAYCSYWVRIVREDLPINDNEAPQKVLIVIWPIFEIRSMLSYPIKCIETKSNQVIPINAAGGAMFLKTPSTHQTEHELYFLDDERDPPSQIASFNLSLKAIDWKKFFWFDEQEWTVEKCLTEFAKPLYNKWPYHENEQHIMIKRPIMLSRNVNHLVFKCAPSRELSCTLSLELAPWGMFVNSTTENIRLIFKDPEIFLTVDPNAISMIPDYKNGFYIEVRSALMGAASSGPIYSDKSNAKEKDSIVLTEKSTSIVYIIRGEILYRFLLEIKFADNKNVIFLKSPVIITNFTKHNLRLMTFCMAEKESIDLRSTLNQGMLEETSIDIPSQQDEKSKNGFLLDKFYDCFSSKNKRGSSTKYMFYLVFKNQFMNENRVEEISMPIFLNFPFDRKAVCAIIDGEQTPLALNTIVHEGICYVNVFEDVFPTFEIFNETNLKFFIAQTKSSEKSKLTEAINEFDGNNFIWNQLILGNCRTFYTPPEICRSFPTMEQNHINLTLALHIDSTTNTNKSLKWSKIINTTETGEKFVNIAWFGNIKVVICSKHRTKKIALYYISQEHEFCVKDLRSRLLCTTPKNSSSNESVRTESPKGSSYNNDLMKEICAHIRPKDRHTKDITTPKTVIKITCFVKEFALKMFQDGKTTDYLKQEVIAIYVDELFIAFKELDSNLQLIFTNIQIDNQLFSTGDYDFQVVFCSKEIYPKEKKSSMMPSILLLDNYMQQCIESGSKQFPLLSINVDFYEDTLSMRKIFCKANQIRIYVEDTYITNLLDFALECLPSFAEYQPPFNGVPVVLEPLQAALPYEVLTKAMYLSEPFHLESLNIQALSVLLSVHTCVRLYIALDHSPLEFAVYERKNVFSLPLNLGHTLGMHYLSGAIFGAGWVVGSLEILGSPSGFARSLTVGLKDFVSLPVQGLFRGPWGFVLGVTQGSASLLKNITAGTVNSVTKLASSVARNLDRLTLDDEHIQRTEALRRVRPQGLAEGLTYGLTGLGISILGAIGGIARHTLNASSPTQIITGVGKGIVGVLAKPISGAAELVALTGQGVLHTVGFNEMPKQRNTLNAKNMFVHPSNSTILKLLPDLLASDQILFAHEAMMATSNGGQMKKVMLYMTSTVFAFLETEKPTISAVVQLDKIEAKIDDDDPTVLRVYVQDGERNGEEADFTKRRIMQFLQSYLSETDIPRITTSSLEDVLRQENNPSPDSPLVDFWTFYLNPHLAEYFLQYLKIIHSEIK